MISFSLYLSFPLPVTIQSYDRNLHHYLNHFLYQKEKLFNYEFRCLQECNEAMAFVLLLLRLSKLQIFLDSFNVFLFSMILLNPFNYSKMYKLTKFHLQNIHLENLYRKNLVLVFLHKVFQSRDKKPISSFNSSFSY